MQCTPKIDDQKGRYLRIFLVFALHPWMNDVWQRDRLIRRCSRVFSVPDREGADRANRESVAGIFAHPAFDLARRSDIDEPTSRLCARRAPARGGVAVTARDVVEMFEPELADAKTKATQAAAALGPMVEEAKSYYAKADRDTQVVLALAAGLLLGKVVSRLGR
jgi:hypothetical protein